MKKNLWTALTLGTTMAVAAGSGCVMADEVNSDALKAGIAIVSSPRIGSADDQNVPVYSLNEVVAFVITDEENRLVDLEIDIVEATTPNHGNENDNMMAGWPGQSYNADLDFDGVTETELTDDEDSWGARVDAFRSKRQLGDGYMLVSGNYGQEMDIYEEYLKGKNADEIRVSIANLFSDVNGRPLNGKSTNEEDIAKAETLTDEQIAEIDQLSGATISINDAHGNMIEAVLQAMDASVVIDVSQKEISSMGLGIKVNSRIHQMEDTNGASVNGYVVSTAGTLFDEEGRILYNLSDLIEIVTPNHPTEGDNTFYGWPKQTYSADLDNDLTAETEVTATEENFLQMPTEWASKRALGEAYSLVSGSWAEEMDRYSAWFAGKTTDELVSMVGEIFSDTEGKPLFETVRLEADIEKREALSAEQLSEIDALSGATISLTDSHGLLLDAVVDSWTNAKEF